MIGVSEYSTANLTEAAQQLILNSVYYVLGMEIPTGIVNVNGNVNDSLSHREGWDESFNLLGQRVDDGYKGIVIINGNKVMR